VPRDAQEFANFLARHYRQIEAMCRERVRFTSDDEAIAFLRPFTPDDKSLVPLINRMRAVGVLIDLAGEWCPAPFLVAFIDELDLRHVLASPSVIHGWIETLERHVDELLRCSSPAELALGTYDRQHSRDLIRDIAEVFQMIIRTIQDNCERITAEVAEYRKTEDAARLRNRLNRLIQLHDEYLAPVIQTVDVGGEFYSATEKVANCCTRIIVHHDRSSDPLGEDARSLRRDVAWLRRVVLRSAEEARRELAPLCEAAVRESQIARGVNRSIDAIMRGEWHVLRLHEMLNMVVEKDAVTVSDWAVEQYLRDALAIKDQLPPCIPDDSAEALIFPITAADLLEKLETGDAVPDLLDWVLDVCDEVRLGEAVRLFHAILSLRPERVAYSEERKTYSRANLAVSAMRWTWKGSHDGQSDSDSNGRPPARKARKRISLT
jgi:hypothetical protein